MAHYWGHDPFRGGPERGVSKDMKDAHIGGKRKGDKDVTAKVSKCDTR